MRKYRAIPNPFPKPYEALWDMNGVDKLQYLKQRGWGEAEAVTYCNEMMQTWEREKYGWGNFSWEGVPHATNVAELGPSGTRWRVNKWRTCVQGLDHQWQAGPYLAWMNGGGGVVNRCGVCGLVERRHRISGSTTGYVLDDTIEDNWVHHRPDYQAYDVSVGAEDYGLTQEEQRERVRLGLNSWQINARLAHEAWLAEKAARAAKNKIRREKATAKRIAARMVTA